MINYVTVSSLLPLPFSFLSNNSWPKYCSRETIHTNEKMSVLMRTVIRGLTFWNSFWLEEMQQVLVANVLCLKSMQYVTWLDSSARICHCCVLIMCTLFSMHVSVCLCLSMPCITVLTQWLSHPTNMCMYWFYDCIEFKCMNW